MDDSGRRSADARGIGNRLAREGVVFGCVSGYVARMGCCSRGAVPSECLPGHGTPIRPARTGLNMAERYVIGVDGGTESLRAGVFDLQGLPRAFASSAYSTNFPQPSWAEQNPHDWWLALGLA